MILLRFYYEMTNSITILTILLRNMQEKVNKIYNGVKSASASISNISASTGVKQDIQGKLF